MREIKFRAWDKEKNKMLDNVFYDPSSNWIMEQHDYGTSNYNNRFILEQYTGLKDKNGVEIYEGDIVVDYDDNKYIVEYRESTLSFDIKRFADSIFDCPLSYMNTNGGYEVIGNIHD